MRAGRSPAPRERVERERDVLGDRQRLEQREVLEHHADAERARARAGLAIATGLPFPEDRRRRPAATDAVDDLHQRRLAGAVLAQHRVDLAGQHDEVDAVVGDDRGIDLGDAATAEARRRNGLRRRWRRRSSGGHRVDRCRHCRRSRHRARQSSLTPALRAARGSPRRRRRRSRRAPCCGSQARAGADRAGDARDRSGGRPRATSRCSNWLRFACEPISPR